MILITGISGGLAQRVAQRLLERGEDVVGVDYRESRRLPSDLTNMPIYRARYNKTALEDVFRKHRFDSVLHLGRVASMRVERAKRFDLNVLGTQKLMNLCVTHGVKNLVVLSTFHIYGADPLNHTPIAEDDPIRAGYEFRAIADAIQLDNMATTWIYQHREVRTVVLRPTNVIGPSIQNTISQFIRMEHVPYLAGFDPMMQFIHEEDLGAAVVAALDGDAYGVFNLAGPDVIPWRTALRLAKTKAFPVPTALSRFIVRTFALFPSYLVNFYKYPCVITDALFRKTFGWEPKVGVREAIESAVAKARARRQ